MINVSALIQYAKNAVGGGYVYGSNGQVCTEKLLADCAAANPSQKENILGTSRKWLGKRVWDCSGLFRGAWEALWRYRSGGATTIWTTWCTGGKGTIDTMPDTPGIAVFRQDGTGMGHIGLYIGDGMVVDARGSSVGVLHGTLTSYGKWTHWAYLDDVDYSNGQPVAEVIPALWTGHVKTKTGGGISLWKDASKKSAVCKVPEGAAVGVMGDPDGMGFAEAQYAGFNGVADLQYVVPEDGEEPAQEGYVALVTGVKESLNLRSKANMDAGNTLLFIPLGGKVDVFPQMASGNFTYVRYMGAMGYCTAAYLKKVDEGGAA